MYNKFFPPMFNTFVTAVNKVHSYDTGYSTPQNSSIIYQLRSL